MLFYTSGTTNVQKNISFVGQAVQKLEKCLIQSRAITMSVIYGIYKSVSVQAFMDGCLNYL